MSSVSIDNAAVFSLRDRPIVKGAAIVAALVTVLLLTFPRTQTVLAQDDLDFVSELKQMSFSAYALKTNPAGQFLPVFKALYGAGMLAFRFNTIPLQIVFFLIRMATLGLFLALLHRLGLFTFGGAIIVLAAGVTSIGMDAVFFWPLLGALELALFFFALALILIVGLRERNSVLLLFAACASLVAASLSWGAGFVAPIATAAGYTGAHGASLRRSRPTRIIAIALWMTTIAVFALYFITANHSVTDNSLSGALANWRVVGRAFFYGAIVNGALSGLFPLVFPGVVHVIVFALLCAGICTLFVLDADANVRFVALAVLLAQLGIPALVALTRWQAGVLHATSPRYIYPNVPLQLFLFALIGGFLAQRLAFRTGLAATAIAVFVAAAVAGAQGRTQHIAYEASRSQCVDKIVAQPRVDPCLSSIYYRSEPVFVRDVWLYVRKERSQ